MTGSEVAVADGGSLALAYAAAHPERVQALVLFNGLSTVPAGGPELDEIADLLAGVTEELWGTEEYVKLLAPSITHDKEQSAWWAKYMRATASPRAAAVHTRATARWRIEGLLPLVQAPTLVVDQKLVLPADLALLFRVLLRLQGLGRGVGTEVRVTELLEPYMTSMMAERFDPRRIGRQLARTARGWDRFATALPGDIQDILEQIRAGNLGVHFRIHDPDGAIDHLVDGLVASASVLAAAQLVSRRTGPLIGPFSVPGIVVAGVGMITWQRLVRRRSEHPTWVSRARELVEARRPRPANV